jgi:hypothetical protein
MDKLAWKLLLRCKKRAASHGFPRVFFRAVVYSGSPYFPHGFTCLQKLMPMTTRMAAPLLGLGLLAIQPGASADVYVCVDAQGRRELTDTNRPGCRVIPNTSGPAMIAAGAQGAGPRRARGRAGRRRRPGRFPAC